MAIIIVPNRCDKCRFEQNLMPKYQASSYIKDSVTDSKYSISISSSARVTEMRYMPNCNNKAQGLRIIINALVLLGAIDSLVKETDIQIKTLQTEENLMETEKNNFTTVLFHRLTCKNTTSIIQTQAEGLGIKVITSIYMPVHNKFITLQPSVRCLQPLPEVTVLLITKIYYTFCKLATISTRLSKEISTGESAPVRQL